MSDFLFIQFKSKAGPLPEGFLPVEPQKREVTYRTGKSRNTWWYYTPSDWKRLMNNRNFTPDIRDFAVMLNNFFLKEEHAFVGKRGIAVGLHRFLIDNHAEISRRGFEILTCILAAHLLEKGIITSSENAYIFDSLTNALIEKQPKQNIQYEQNERATNH